MAYQTRESRYQHAEQYLTDGGLYVLEDREPFRYTPRDDNVMLVAAEGDTWESMAQRLYDGISERACGLYWIGLDFQPTPVVDPTIPIRPGTVVHWPSTIVVINEIFGRPPERYQ